MQQSSVSSWDSKEQVCVWETPGRHQEGFGRHVERSGHHVETSGRHVETSGRHVGMSTVEALNQSVPDEFTRLCITEEYIDVYAGHLITQFSQACKTLGSLLSGIVKPELF